MLLVLMVFVESNAKIANSLIYTKTAMRTNLTESEIKLDDLRMIQKYNGRAMSFTKYRARRAASSMIFLELIATTISLSIMKKKKKKKPANFIIIMFRI